MAMLLRPPTFTTGSARTQTRLLRGYGRRSNSSRTAGARRQRAQLELALEFFRAAGAERYVREAEAVLSVS